MLKQPSDRHICGLCGCETQTLHGRACVDCQKKVLGQIHKYLSLAALIHLEVNAMFNTYTEDSHGKV